MSNLKYKLEALLFSSARSMTIDELINLTKADADIIKSTLKELESDYEKRDSSIVLIDEGNSFKLNVKSEHANVVQQVVSTAELSKTLMETLAVIAFKYPIKQSDLIKIRTNKAYDHLKELEESGFIARQKFGRSKIIKLTPKFFEYFDLPEEKLKSKFEGFEGIAKAISQKESEIKEQKAQLKKEAQASKEVDLVDDQGNPVELEQYDVPKEAVEKEESKEVAPVVEKVGELEVTDVPDDDSDEYDDDYSDEGYGETDSEEVVSEEDSESQNVPLDPEPPEESEDTTKETTKVQDSNDVQDSGDGGPSDSDESAEAPSGEESSEEHSEKNVEVTSEEESGEQTGDQTDQESTVEDTKNPYDEDSEPEPEHVEPNKELE